MSNYLFENYKGKYRVLADYDWDTMDYPRDNNDNIDSTFNDFYISGSKGIQVWHAGRNKLGCYIESKGAALANSKIREIYKREFSKECSDIKKVEKELLENGILLDVTHYDNGALIIFKADKLDDWADIFKLHTNGANISPLSSKNLPKSNYKIPIETEQEYNNCFENINDKNIKMRIALNAAAKMKDRLTKAQKTDMKKQCMKIKQYAHYAGLWNKYIKILEEEVKENTKWVAKWVELCLMNNLKIVSKQYNQIINI